MVRHCHLGLLLFLHCKHSLVLILHLCLSLRCLALRVPTSTWGVYEGRSVVGESDGALLLDVLQGLRLLSLTLLLSLEHLVLLAREAALGHSNQALHLLS